MSFFFNNASSSNPLEQTTVFLIARLTSQINDCEELLLKVDDLYEKRAGLKDKEKSLSEKEYKVDLQHSKRIEKVDKDLNESRKVLENAEKKARHLRDALKKLEERYEALNLGRLSQDDLAFIDRAIEEKTKPQAEKLSQAEKQSDISQRKIDALTEAIHSDEEELKAFESDLILFDRGIVPERYLNPIEIAQKNATDVQDTVIRGLEEKRVSLVRHCSDLELEITKLEGRIRQLEAKDSELKQVSSKGILMHIGSFAWWGSLVSDYAKKAQSASLKREQLLKDLEDQKKQISSVTSSFEEATSKRSSILKAAEEAERKKQHDFCLSNASSLPQKIKEKKATLSDLNTLFASSQKEIEAIRVAFKDTSAQTAEESRKNLICQTKAALDELISNVSAADREVDNAKARVNENTLSLDHLREALRNEKAVAIENLKIQLEESRKSVHFTEEALFKEARKLGIENTSCDIKQLINNRRSHLISELGEQQRKLKLKTEETKDKGIDKRNKKMSYGELNTKGEENVQSKGNIYFDFSTNAEDNQDQYGKTYKGLRSQMLELKRSLGRKLFPDSSDGEELLLSFIDKFFPEGISQEYYISNISIREDQPYLSIRPQFIGPRLEAILPRGRTLAVCGKLWNNQRDKDNPVFLVQRIVEISHSRARPFEFLISGVVFRKSQSEYRTLKRNDNVLSNDFITKLPLISILTKDRLQDWSDYLDWRERIVIARLVGLRYIHVDVLEKGLVRFLTVCKSQAGFEQVRRTLRDNNLYAYGLEYSQDPWQFEYNDSYRVGGVELGDFVSHNEDVQNPANANIVGVPWDEPFFSYVYFRLPEDAQNEFDCILNNGGTIEEAARPYLNDVDPNGFLALSVIGDLSLVKRQRAELQQLRDQSGYSPFLSSYLFDIQAANEPTELITVTDEKWFQSNLNDDQRSAVRKIISTPDLAMVQGPPGTGKTTVISEATLQFVHEGKKVLLVSQASLAVNNVLERLAQIPEIRAIRLSHRERRNEREHPYSKEHALKTYYHSIAETCRKRTLNVWKKADSRAKELSDWITSFDLVSNDLNSLREKAKEKRKEFLSVEEELKLLRKTEERSRSLENQKSDIVSFCAFIKGGDPFSGSVPDQILTVFYNNVVRLLDRLTEFGIRINALWPQLEYGSSLERTRFAEEVVLNWRKVFAFKQQISGDIERLQATDRDSVLSSEVELRLAELQRKLETTQKAMETDAKKVEEWQSIQKEIREVKRQGTGLDRETYSRLLNIPDCEMLSAVTSSGTTRAEVVSLLNQLQDLLCKTESEIKIGIDTVSKEIEKYLDDITVESVDKKQLDRLEGQFRHLTVQENDIKSEISNKECRLNEIKTKYPQIGRPTEFATVNNGEIRNQAIKELNDLKKQINDSKNYRELWGDLLEQWIKNLTDEEMIRCDQDNFLKIYIDACNVVGVTCTENRRTLEDSGHTWFDCVIVDEVSKATPTEILMPLMMARTAILVGDHRQLPPLFKEQEGSWEEVIADQEESEDANKNSNSELTAVNFKRFKNLVTSSLFKEHFEKAPDKLKSFLFTQYRMHPQIMRVVNQFYENRLQCGLVDPDGEILGSDPRGHRVHGLTLVGEKSQQYIVPERHVAWLDSTHDPYRKPHYERRDLGNSKVNELECVLIAKTLFHIELSCREQGFGSNGQPPKEVGIITFYARQVRAIREAIKRIQSLHNIRFNAIEYDINTVDRYQGQERPVILVSMVRNPIFPLSQRANTAQFERINVAFSRAQELLVVVGAKDVFCTYPVSLPNLDRPGNKKVEVYRYIIEEIQRNGGLWSSDCIVSQQEYEELLPPGFSSKQSYSRRNQNNNYYKG